MADYSTYDKPELLKIIAKQEKELKTKKYGLVWDSEREPEQVVLDCGNNLPILKRVKSKEIRTDDSEDNILIEGDNYHALTVLNYTHKEKIDVIYIDPPYNTGKENEWKYNDKFIDNNDGFRHSKWLNLFEKRLKLAKNLLKENGIIFISIDDNEIAQAKLVCDKIFNGNASQKDSNLLGLLIWDLGTGTQAGHFVRSHEYILVYANDKSKFPNFKGGGGTIKHSALKKISRKNPASEFTFPDGFKFEATDNFELTDSWGDSETTTIISGRMICKNGKLHESVVLSAGWAMKSQMENWIYKDKENTFDSKGQRVLEFYFNKSGVLTYRKERSVTNPPTVLRNIASTKTGSTELKEIFNGKSVFDFPKPSVLIKELLNYFPKDIVILDYFAGTGTTGHAALQLNNEDGGNRTFILCTNNENNIC
ncbi:MAG: site-specific DNA-methyltransferase, partial [Candidatus Anammoxibacter sp.]